MAILNWKFWKNYIPEIASEYNTQVKFNEKLFCMYRYLCWRCPSGGCSLEFYDSSRGKREFIGQLKLPTSSQWPKRRFLGNNIHKTSPYYLVVLCPGPPIVSTRNNSQFILYIFSLNSTSTISTLTNKYP